ncbi:MAG: SPOR domain-containing protein [Caulobacteraceae bacterium]|nr:SPOR domain-containing protein [Caulobacteraceae bacterium]
MSDHDRGPYTPRSEAPLAFDPRRPVRGAGPVPLTLIVSGLVLVALIGAVAFVYRGGVRRADQPPAPVGQPLTDIKTPAPPPAAANDVAAGLSVYRTDGGAPAASANAAAPTLAPPPEQPTLVTATPSTPPAAPPAVAAQAAPPPPAPPAPPKAPGADGSLSLNNIEDTAAARSAAARPPAPKAKTPGPDGSLSLATLEDAASARAARAGGPPAGASWVQIGAVSSPDLADKAWHDLARLVPAAMAGKGEKVEAFSKDGRNLYRTYVTGFRGRDQAQAFCEKLKAAGKACLVK